MAISKEKKAAVLRAYFEEGLEAEEIAARLKITPRTVRSVLSDPVALEPYRKQAEAAKLRAQICVNESAVEAAKKQAELMRMGEGEVQASAASVSQRAAKDILDRAGVRTGKEDRKDVTVRFAFGTPEIGMPGEQHG